MVTESGFVLAERAARWESAASWRREGGRVRWLEGPRSTRAVNPGFSAHPRARKSVEGR